MKGSTKALLLSAVSSGVVTGGLYWFGLNAGIALIIWAVATVSLYPKVLQDMANEKILDHDWPTRDGADRR
ncbi:hypothetical protein CPT32_30195 [Rhizobium sophoriradicis]|uniref:hypothetical protein n=1 Tax=Rhizobium sophoriradicis TaxID=1535245 RepID=UPI000BBDE206|nr:hypothetical protein [Rhizobium sophoriradicis]PCK83274.1 hypothetical protein CPT32_30195 [Rhizobium sophoriradicis]